MLVVVACNGGNVSGDTCYDLAGSVEEYLLTLPVDVDLDVLYAVEDEVRQEAAPLIERATTANNVPERVNCEYAKELVAEAIYRSIENQLDS